MVDTFEIQHSQKTSTYRHTSVEWRDGVMVIDAFPDALDFQQLTRL